MATSQQWRHAALLLGAALVVLVIGTADACPPGYKDCDAYKPGCETSIKTDVNNCGDCNKKCKTLPYTYPKCVYGVCEYKCQPGWADCDHNIYSNGCEKDVRNDIYNCGDCKHKCPVTLKGGEATCSYGVCKQQCKKGTKYDNAKRACVPAY